MPNPMRAPKLLPVGLVAVTALALALQPVAAVPLPKPRPAGAPASASAKPTAKAGSKADAKSTAPRPAPAARLAAATSEPISSADIAALREAIAAARKGRTSEAADLERTISDPVARKLVEWAILRNDETETIELKRYLAFIAENPSWPAIGLLRRRAEATLWTDRLDPAFVRAFFSKDKPTTTKGKFALARALLLLGDRAAAQSIVREAWRYDTFSDDLESMALDVFKDLLTPADHKARMDMRLYAEDVEGALQSADRAGGNAPVIAKARIAVIKKAANAKALLDAVPAEVQRHDVGYILSRVQFLRRADKAAEAAELILSIPSDHGQTIDTDQWWIERRLVARKLLDLEDYKTAYRIARDAAIPSRENYRAEHQFTAGWIALRFLHDPAVALGHFTKVAVGNRNPISLARAGYWQGRAAEALGRNSEARSHYETAARYSTAYYGQMARAARPQGDRAASSARARGRSARRRRQARARAGDRAALQRRRARPDCRIIGRSRRTGDGCFHARGGRRGRRAQSRCARHAAARQGGARARDAARALCLSERRNPRVPRHRTGDRARRHLRHRPPGEHFQPENRLQRARHGPDAGDPRRRALRHQEIRRVLRREAAAERPDLQRAAGRGRARRPAGRLSRLLHSHLRRLQRRTRAGAGMDREIWRPARSEGRPDRLGRADSVLRDAQLRATGARESAG